VKTRDIVDLVVLGAIWGSSFLFMRIAAPEFGPVSLVTVRVGIAAMFLVIALALTGGLTTMWRKAVPGSTCPALMRLSRLLAAMSPRPRSFSHRRFCTGRAILRRREAG